MANITISNILPIEAQFTEISEEELGIIMGGLADKPKIEVKVEPDGTIIITVTPQ
ncbi:hypothetical protein [Nostoc sphaeroides]|uniref:Uncharacterized protein n=1 Tax=Nostoc sphaeroides CCNUC1 TaxID=2653204 RepID=A0A5P8VVQ0_9NOSO|nr:hypothetical protein [Nostoc sphaeroides]MCC5629012.1 hypothetical protein [Nostoc sphaeroides CHAB 2801]QFS44493.1 hypothetical protein GXM_01968 [Nostoc sphaeroides CCNUC1]